MQRDMRVRGAWMLAAAGACAAIGAPAEVLAQDCSWTGIFLGTAPEARSGAKMVFDSQRARVVMYGGSQDFLYDSTRPDTTWEWDGANWAQTASAGPGGRIYHAMAYDSVRHVTVLFAGATPGTDDTSDTWTYNGSLWTQVATTGPSVRNGAAMVFDSGRGVAVLFGGYDGTNRLGDTWEWSGTAWTQRSAGGASDPQPRIDTAMAYDAARGVCVIFGGNGPTTYLGDTWEWNGAAGTWTLRSAGGAGAPEPRSRCGFTYDSSRHVTLMFGGEEPSANGNNDLWQWDGSAWTQIDTASGQPGVRWNAPMVYDSVHGNAVLFSGIQGSSVTLLDDTWLLSCGGSGGGCYANCDGSTAAPVLNVADFTCFFQKFATGNSYANCDGSTGVPVLNVQDFTCFLQKFAVGCP
jgi:Galactose oxidase, central domain